MKKAKQQFTDIDHSDWEDYEMVRQSGAYNMFDPRAKEATGLSDRRYSFILRNYSEILAERKALQLWGRIKP